ncbi:enoyl-CoA hydratase [Variovorax sp. WS11]|uniref:enoyl-CoA hydratase/isomerase family protein n=1 Tax=Variovorax sp. WS11 TaxID=1105204 RepID=UPI000D0E07B3|nr:enoyl-CoA hydratase-related protein [Variovorax sp. WS11]NDZ18883.1 enoyl-CoA hydratase/isomerase family protein [Variovorax sp. WS11]PSL80051.1 enoyl-CoA hydratase [Variovorax sp. WS11]
MVEPVLVLDRPAAHVGRLRINRPDKRNAIDYDVRQGFIDALPALLADGQTRALVLGGTQGAFSAGGDVTSMEGLDEQGARERMRHIHVLCGLVANAGIPVVSAMEGFAAGAVVGLALLGDHIVAGPGTKVMFPFLKLGLAPDWGQLLTLPRRVGLGVARRILASGETVTGEEAFRIGLADTLVPDAEVMDTAVAKAADLARLPADAFACMKRRLNEPSASLAAEFKREEDDQAMLLTGPGFREGFDALRSKRAPDFIALARATMS